MNRRDMLYRSAMLGLLAAVSPESLRASAGDDSAKQGSVRRIASESEQSIPVAFPISDEAVVIDFCGPWSAFECVDIPGRKTDAFKLYTVAESRNVVKASNGLMVQPNHTLQDAPAPKLIVIAAQKGSPAIVDWVLKHSHSTDVTFSVCGGSFLLAQTGLLDGKAATTHHNAFDAFAKLYPKIELRKGVRWVEEGNLATSGGLTAGIDLALHIVERYFGREIALRTAYYMEYQGTAWKDTTGSSNPLLPPA